MIFRRQNKKLVQDISSAALFLGAAFLFLQTNLFADSAKPTRPDPELKRVIKEAESLSLSQERLFACTVLQRNLKKNQSKESFKILREKLNSLSKVFFTDSGYELFSGGKDLFEKKKFSDSADKFLEADEFEKGNSEVLHFLTLSYFQAKKFNSAEMTVKRALEINPFDLTVRADQLALFVLEEKWTEAVKEADLMAKDLSDTSPQTLNLKGISQFNLGLKQEALKTFELVIQKDNQLPEAYFFLAGLAEKKEEQALLGKYVGLCKNKDFPLSNRDVNSCSRLAEAEKRIGKKND